MDRRQNKAMAQQAPPGDRGFELRSGMLQLCYQRQGSLQFCLRFPECCPGETPANW